MVDAFISSLGSKMSAAFPTAEIFADGGNLSLEYTAGPGAKFVHIVVDFTCLDEKDTGFVAVHARPDCVFEPHWEEEAVEESDGVDSISMAYRTLVTPATRFDGGDGGDGHEFDDGFGNTMWSFQYPCDEERIAALAVALAGIGGKHFDE